MTDPIADTTPWPQERVASLPLAGAEHDLLEEIMSTPIRDRTTRHVTEPPVRRTPRWLVPVAAALAVALAVGLPLALRGDGDSGSAGGPTYAAGPTRVAESNPRLLVRAPVWSVSDVQGFTRSEGEMTFTDGPHELEVSWRPAASYQDYLADRSHDMVGRPSEVLGRRATTFRYNGTDFTTILAPAKVSFLEIRGDLGSRRAYRDILAALTPVSVQTWLAAMPPSVVKPKDMDATVAKMLTGVPLPAGFDSRPLSRDLPNDRYQVGATVSGAVACAWLSRWDTAVKAGDDAAAKQAVNAMATSHRWKVLRDMDAEGDYPEAVWETADGMKGKHLDLFDGKLTRQVWTQGLGCDEAPRNANLTP